LYVNEEVRYGWLCERLGVASKCPSLYMMLDMRRFPRTFYI
jgi:hypothetical protein